MVTPPPDEPSTSTRSMARDLQENPNRQPGEPRVSEPYHNSIVERIRHIFRTAVSSNRCRTEYQNIDLDCAYITDRIIAIGYPATGIEANFRNSKVQTQQFLTRRHGKGNVKVFNLRGGYYYDADNFDGNVICFDMTDHHPPSLELMAPFCREAKEWLEADDKHVIAVHCKAGKGRTGVMICALLIYINFYPSPRQILDYYSIIRTKNNKGVTIPSQRRYIYYYHKLRERELNYLPLRMQLIGVYVERPPKTWGGGSKIKVEVGNGSTILFKPDPLIISKSNHQRERATWLNSCDTPNEFDTGEQKYHGFVSKRAYCFMVPEDAPVFVEGDVRIDIREIGFLKKFSDGKIGHVWFNTMFACDGGLNGGHFEYVDKTQPYIGDDTSIGRKNGMRRNETPMRKIDPETGNEFESPWQIVNPPGLEKHITEEQAMENYTNYGMIPPRYTISKILHEKHEKGIVKDDYNDRKLPMGDKSYTESGKSGDIRGVGGPFEIPYKAEEHVLTFPVYEMDRALKSKDLNNGMKLHVVLRCVDTRDSKMMEKSEVFGNLAFHNESTRRLQALTQMNPKWRPEPCAFGSKGAEMHYPPSVRYSSNDGKYNGACSENLVSDFFEHRNIAVLNRYCRYFYKQRSTSRSRYPRKFRYCPLIKKHFYIPADTDDVDENGQPFFHSPEHYIKEQEKIDAEKAAKGIGNTGPSTSGSSAPGTIKKTEASQSDKVKPATEDELPPARLPDNVRRFPVVGVDFENPEEESCEHKTVESIAGFEPLEHLFYESYHPNTAGNMLRQDYHTDSEVKIAEQEAKAFVDQLLNGQGVLQEFMKQFKVPSDNSFADYVTGQAEVFKAQIALLEQSEDFQRVQANAEEVDLEHTLGEAFERFGHVVEESNGSSKNPKALKTREQMVKETGKDTQKTRNHVLLHLEANHRVQIERRETCPELHPEDKIPRIAHFSENSFSDSNFDQAIYL